MLSASMYSETRREQSRNQQTAHGSTYPLMRVRKESAILLVLLAWATQTAYLATSANLTSGAVGIEAEFSGHLSSGTGAHLPAPNYRTNLT